MKKAIQLSGLVVLLTFLTTFIGCQKDPETSNRNTMPTVATAEVSEITFISATSGGDVISEGSNEVTARGVCWNTTEMPTVENNKSLDGISSGSFVSYIYDLHPGTTYFVRAFAVSRAGISYGKQLSFTTNSFQSVPIKDYEFPGGVRYSAASFSIGTKLYIGLGYNDGDWPVRDLWEWDQSTNLWTAKAAYPGNSTGVSVSFSIGTKGYIGTGNDANTAGFTNEFWEYDPSTNSWTKKASLPATPARASAVGFSIGTKGYIATGAKDAYTGVSYFQAFQDFWEWDQPTNVWTKKADFGGIARAGAVGFSIGNKGYIGTGSDDGNIQLKDFWEWDQSTNVWTPKADFGGVPRSEAIGFSIGNKGYIGTGYGDDGTLFNDFWEWDQATNLWTKKTDFGGSPRTSAFGISVGGKGYIGTGATGVNPDYAFGDFWEWDQSANTWTKK